MTDRKALAADLESLGSGCKAIAGSVRNGQLSLERILRSVERKRDKARRLGDEKVAEAAQRVLDKYRGDGS